MSNLSLSDIFAGLKTLEQKALASGESPVVKDIADATTNLIDKLEAGFPELSKLLVNRLIETIGSAVPLLSWAENPAEAIADPLIVELASVMQKHLLGTPAVAPQPQSE